MTKRSRYNPFPMKNLREGLLFALLVLLPLSPSKAQQREGEEEKPVEIRVVVSTALAPQGEETAPREVVVVERASLPVGGTLLDLLSALPMVDVQPRVAGGLFGDIKMRGADYGGVLVCIDGVRWNDPQTAHFNGSIPIPLELVERVEVVTGGHSLFFGTDAVGGVINVITRRDRGREGTTRLSVGSFGAREAGIGLGDSWKGMTLRGAYKAARDGGFRPNRDHSLSQGGVTAALRFLGGESRLSLFSMDHSFGAEGFYGPYPSWEKTDGDGVIFETVLDRGLLGKEAGPARVSLSWRRNKDLYYLYREKPELYRNEHTNNTFLLKGSSSLWRGREGELSLLLEGGRTNLRSARLGDHDYNRFALALEGVLLPFERGLLQVGIRWDRYSLFGSSLSPGLGLSWSVTPRLKLRSSLGGAFRVPSFTELYYLAPGTVGNKDLKPEKALSLEGGGDLFLSPWRLSLTLFHRWEGEGIDWVRRDPQEPWRAENIGKARVLGVSFFYERSCSGFFNLWGGYSWTKVDAERNDFFSRYARDTVRHHLSLGMKGKMGRWGYVASLQYKYRPQGERTALPLGLSVTFSLWGGELFLRGENLLGRSYEEVPDVPLPRRSFQAGWSARFSSGKS